MPRVRIYTKESSLPTIEYSLRIGLEKTYHWTKGEVAREALNHLNLLISTSLVLVPIHGMIQKSEIS